MRVAARPALMADLAVVTALAEEAIEELTPRRGGAIWALSEARRVPLSDEIADEMSRADASVFVGTIDDTIVGYAAAHSARLHNGEAMARITDLYVLSGARKVGVGESLIEAISAWARDKQLIALDSLALPGDRDTKNFFESFGLVARSITVHRRL